MRLLAALALFSLLLAGCVTPPDTTLPADTGELPEGVRAALLAAMAGVPCDASSIGRETSENILDLSHLAFGEGSNGEVDVFGDLALVARYQLGGFYVVSLRNPLEPTLVSTFEAEDTGALDVKWLPSGDGALIGNYAAVQMVDLADPANPVLRNTFTYADAGLPNGQAHMLEVAVIDGKEYVFIATQTSRQPAYILERDGWNLTHVSSYGLPVLQSTELGNHDMTVVQDPMLDNATIMYLANGLAGWDAVDVSDPTKPTRIGGSLQLDPFQGYTHTVRVEWLEGKRIVVTMMEVGVNTLRVYDATNLQLPVLLAQWRADPARPHIPQHNIQLHGTDLYLAHYTEGVYAFNLSDVVGGSLPLLGSLDLAPVAHWAVPEPQAAGALGFANVWDVVLHNGILYANDMTSGLHAFGYGCLSPGDATQTRTD